MPPSRTVPALTMAVLAVLLAVSPTALAEHIPVGEFRKGCGFTEDDYEEGVYDCSGSIPSIQNPGFVPASDANWLDGDDRVIGIENNGTAKAYPIPILNWHEIVNDEIGGDEIVVTYCPLCDSSVVYDRNVDGRTLDFHVSGYLFRADLVMIDEQTNSLWPQILGEGARGEFHGTALDLYTSTTTTWNDWKSQYPETQVLERPRCDDGSTENRRSCSGPFQRDYDRSPYRGYESSNQVGVGGESRGFVKGLHPKANVVGVTVNDTHKAYPLANLSDELLVNDELAGQPLAVLWAGADAHVYKRPGGVELSLTSNNTTLETSDGRAWNAATGQAIGDHPALERAQTLDLFWFAWLDHHPTTQLYTSNGTVDVNHDPPQPSTVPGPGLLGVVGVLVGLALVGCNTLLNPRGP